MNDVLQQLTQKLQRMGIHSLRQIGRVVGVYSPTIKKKAELIDDIVGIAGNRIAPVPKSTLGAPPKSDAYDEELVNDILKCREYFSDNSAEKGEEPEINKLTARSPEEYDEDTYSGILELSDKYWFIRTQNLQISSTGDVFVHVSFINRYRLRVGDYIVCKAKRRKENECPGLTYVISVNGQTPNGMKRADFDGLIPCYPDRRYTLEYPGCSLTERVIDLFAPVGCGQRALLVSPPKVGKTTMLKCVASALTRNYPSTNVMILLIDERPEEVTDIRRSVEGADVYYSTFDKGDNHHIHTAMLALEHAKRLVEAGKDVVILMDSITRLTRAFNAVCNSGRTLSGGLDPQAIVEPKKFFGAARNVEDGGSLTILATVLVDTGSRLDDIIYEEFKSTGNMEIVLSRQLAERRIFPAINVKASGARKEELLLSEEELNAAAKIRSALGREIDDEGLLSAMKNTPNNKEFCTKAETFLRVYKKL